MLEFQVEVESMSRSSNPWDQILQEAMIQEFLRPEFRYKLRDALDGSEGDMVKQATWIYVAVTPGRCPKDVLKDVKGIDNGEGVAV